MEGKNMKGVLKIKIVGRIFLRTGWKGTGNDRDECLQKPPDIQKREGGRAPQSKGWVE